MHDDHPMTIAARHLDAASEEHGMQEYLEGQLGIDLEVAVHVASQRALRLVLISTRGPQFIKGMSQTAMTPVALTPAEDAIMERLTVAALDGIVIGYRAHMLATSGG